MEPFRVLCGRAVPLRLVNVDTDMIIPKQYLKWITRKGIGEGLLVERRLLPDGTPDPGFPLNQARYRGASILVAGDNFGCGSSREQAPWALLDVGIRCVISTSFGDIFHNNCFKNGMLPVRVTPDQLERLFLFCETASPPDFTVDLQTRTIALPGHDPIGFTVDPYQRQLLLEGLDEVALSLEKLTRIESFEARHRALAPWIFDNRSPRP